MLNGHLYEDCRTVGCHPIGNKLLVLSSERGEMELRKRRVVREGDNRGKGEEERREEGILAY